MNENRTRNAIRAALGLLVVIAWSNGLNGEFVYDDKVEVIGNRTIRWLEHWREILTYNIARPVVIFSWAVDLRLWSDNPFGYHLTNVLIHLCNAMLVFAVGERLLRAVESPRPLYIAGVAAALWAVHPMTTESVTYITGRSESLCAMFMLLAILNWLRWRDTESNEGLGWAFGTFLLAVATKEVGAMVPLILLLLEVTLPPSKQPRRKTHYALLGFWAIIVAGAFGRKALFGVFTVDRWLRPLDVQLWTQLEVITVYAKTWFWPTGQTIFHDYPEASGDFSQWAALTLWLTLIATALALKVRRTAKNPWPLIAIGWWLVILIPSSSFVPLLETMAEHRAYLAGWSICFLIAISIDHLLHDKPRVRNVVLTLMVCTLIASTHKRNVVWSTEVQLWSEAVELSPESAEGWYGYADALRFDAQLEEAIEAYNKAATLNPKYLPARTNLGVAQAELGRQKEAEETWLALLKQAPNHCPAHNNLGWLYYRQKRWRMAETEFRTTLRWCPANVQSHYALGNLYYGPLRDAESSAFHYETVLKLDDTFVEAQTARSRLLELTF